MPLNTDKLFAIVDAQIKKMKDVHQQLSAQIFRSPADEQMLQNIEDWMRRIVGAVEGHGAEFELYYTHRFLKKRQVVRGQGIADVAIGTNGDSFAKAIQSKSTVQKGHSAIDDYIKAAFIQLTGEKGETPRAIDRPVIQITIWDDANPWPWTQTERWPSRNIALQQIATRVASVVNATIGQNLSSSVLSFGPPPPPNATRTFVNQFPNTHGATLQRGTFVNRPKQTPDYFVTPHGGSPAVIKTLLVKLKWPLSLVCQSETNHLRLVYIESIAVVGRRTGDQFSFAVEKVKSYEADKPGYSIASLLS